MKLIHIFGGSYRNSEGLYSVQYQEGAISIFEKIFKEWLDPEYMFNYFDEHSQEIKHRFGLSANAELAVDALMDEAEYLRDLLLKTASNTVMGMNLQSIFKPLNNSDCRLTVLQQTKASAKGKLWKDPKLRIYALRIESNTYVVTGGAIKLTNTMKESVYTLAELARLKQVAEWLKGIGIMYSEDLKYFL